MYTHVFVYRQKYKYMYMRHRYRDRDQDTDMDRATDIHECIHIGIHIYIYIYIYIYTHIYIYVYVSSHPLGVRPRRCCCPRRYPICVGQRRSAKPNLRDCSAVPRGTGCQLGRFRLEPTYNSPICFGGGPAETAAHSAATVLNASLGWT